MLLCEAVVAVASVLFFCVESGMCDCESIESIANTTTFELEQTLNLKIKAQDGKV